LVPADAQGRALVDMHMKLCDLQLTRYAGTIIFPKRFLPKDKWNTVAIAEAKAEIEKHFAILSPHLAVSTYLVAEQLSLADICYIPFGVFAADGNHPFNRRRSLERTAARSPERGCHKARKIASEKLVSLRP
jgi:glutathione S-transferase